MTRPYLAQSAEALHVNHCWRTAGGSMLVMDIVRITIRVKPGASRSNVGGAYGDPPALVIAVHKQPVDGQANAAVIQALASALHIRKSDIEVVAGHTGRTKILAIYTDDEQGVSNRLAELLIGSESKES